MVIQSFQSSTATYSLQEFPLVFANFIMSNTASYDNSSSFMGFVSGALHPSGCIWYDDSEYRSVRKYLWLRKYVSETCIINKYKSIFWKWNKMKVKEIKSFDFLRVFSQPVGISRYYFRYPIHYVILDENYLRMFNIKFIFSMNSFIKYRSSYIVYYMLSWTWRYYL
jgi:hypothetical protein